MLLKKISFITTNDGVSWGGSEELWRSCAEEALKQGLDVAISAGWVPLPAKLSSLTTYPNLSLFSKASKYPAWLKLFNKYSPGRFKVKKETYKKQLIEWKPDLVVISQGNNADGLSIMQFCRDNNLAYCTISQAVCENIWPDTGNAARMREGFENSMANYFVSEDNLKVSSLQIGQDIKNARVVRNAFNVAYDQELPYPKSTVLKFACVARYEFYAKGQDVLLEVLSQKKWRERNLEVTFYGSGFNEDAIRRLIKRFELENVFVGGYAPTLEIWERNHALLLPSRFEGLPLALVEAMLCGRFGIVSNVSGNKEVFEDNITGFLAEAPRAEYFDMAMERAWQKRSEWEEIGAKAKAYIKTLVPENPGLALLEEIIEDYKIYR